MLSVGIDLILKASRVDFSFELPADFADYEWEVTAKGYYPEARMTVSGKQYRLNFYDAVRLGQEIQSELERGRDFFVPNLVIVQSVTRADMERAARELALSGQAVSLAEEPPRPRNA
jgi:hypothetical protein